MSLHIYMYIGANQDRLFNVTQINMDDAKASQKAESGNINILLLHEEGPLTSHYHL